MLGCQQLVRQTQGVLLQVSSEHVLFPSSSAMASYKVGCWLRPCFDQLQLLWYSQGWGARGASSGHHLWAGSPAVPSLACCSLLLVFPIVGKCVTVTEMMLWLSAWDPNRVGKKDQIFKRPLVCRGFSFAFICQKTIWPQLLEEQHMLRSDWVVSPLQPRGTNTGWGMNRQVLSLGPELMCFA